MTTRIEIANREQAPGKRLSVKVFYPDTVEPVQWYFLAHGDTQMQYVHSGARVEIEEVD